jgi:cytochrome c oxidase subunit 1
MPFFTWAMFVIGFLLLLAFPPLEVAAILQLSDRVFGASSICPPGLMEGGQHLDISGGGSPMLYQHLFWFLAHPEVYVLILPAFAILTEVIPNNARRPLWGYKSMVYSVLTLGFLSFLVWAHHMYLTGMGTMMSTYFQITTVLISVPSVILLTCTDDLAVGRLHPLQHADALRLCLPAHVRLRRSHRSAAGIQFHRPRAARHLLRDRPLPLRRRPRHHLRLFAGIYHWFPKITGRFMSDRLGKWHFWPSLIGMNMVFLPMIVPGHGGLPPPLV